MMSMVSYAELCQAIERWQRSQGRVTALESALQQAMWRGFIQHHAPEVHMEFQGDLEPNHAEEDPGYPAEHEESLGNDFGSGQEPYQDQPPFAATGS